MNLTPAEDWMFKAGCRKPNRKIGGIKVVTGLNIDDIRQIQADALRFAAEQVKERAKGNHMSVTVLAERWTSGVISQANQLHPLPEAKRQQGTPTGPPPEDPIPAIGNRGVQNLKGGDSHTA